MALREVSYPLVGKRNVLSNRNWYPLNRFGNVSFAEQDFSLVAIKLAGVAFDRCAPISLDLGQHTLHCLTGSSVNGGLGRVCFFEVFGGHVGRSFSEWAMVVPSHS